MSSSTPSESPSERELFFEALAITSAEKRSVFLDGACFNQPELRRRIEELLASHAQQDSFMQDPALDGQPTLVDNAVVSERPGATIGRYKLLQKVGEGGMGVVYMAEQTAPIVRKTALKIIKLGMDTKQVVARFEAERQALALMDHPNIAKVLDAGATETGRPYFVMELVRGVPITEYCNKNRLPTRQRLELFVSVCHAIQSAHQKGVIHRDIKPSNVMVTLHDGRPVPKVIDFGIAKATNQKLTEKTLFTNYAQMIGTPAYMSPEQAEMSELDVDTRTDVYSLGVLLYELLTGTTPFSSSELLSVGYGEMQRIIAEKEPPKPSTRLSTMRNEERTVVANNQRVDASILGKGIQGDLDWIVMKALEKDRTRRYDTVNGLVADVERHLNNEPVSAVAPTIYYQLQKFYRRNKGFVSAVGLAVALLALTATITTVLAIYANDKKNESVQAKRDAELARAKEARLKEGALKDLYFDRIARAQSEIRANRLADALALLRKCPEEHRNWEWHYLYRTCVSGPSAPLSFQAPVLSVSLDAQRDLLGVLCQDGTIRIRNLKSHEWTVLDVPGWQPDMASSIKGWWPVRWLAFHPDGKRLAVVTSGYRVALIDSSSGSTVRYFEPKYSGRINAIAFNPNGIQIATIGDRMAKVWSLNSEARDFSVSHENVATSLIYSADGKRLITGQFGEGGAVTAWDSATGQKVKALPNHVGAVMETAMSRDGLLASCSSDHSILISDADGSELSRLVGSDNDVASIAFSADGSRLFSGGSDRIIRIWETYTGREILELQPMPFDVMNLVFMPEHNQLLGGSHTEELVVLDGSPFTANTESESVILNGHANEVDSVAFHPTEPVIASGSRDGTIRFWSRRSGEERTPERIFFGRAEIMDLSFHPDGAHLLSVRYGETGAFAVSIATLGELGEGRLLTTDPKEFFSGEFTPDGQHVLAGGRGGIRAFDWKSGEAISTLGPSSRLVWNLTLSPDGRRLASSHSDGIVRVWDAKQLTHAAEGREVYHGVHFAFRPSFSSDSRFLAVGDFDGNLTLVSLVSGAESVRIPRAHGKFVTSATFSPDGRFLATASGDQTVRLWDAKTGEPLKTYFGHDGEINCLAFSPDSTELVSGGHDFSVRIWSVPN